MSLFYRALAYITRKRGRSILLFLLLLVIATLVLSGVAIKDATQTAQLNVRQALGGVFTMEQNTSDSSKWESKEVGSYGTQSWYTGEPLSEEVADTIMEKVNGIRGYNATATNYVVAADSEGNTLDLLESDSDDGMNGLLGSYGDFNSTVATYASTDTAFDSYFTGGYLELVEGRHVTAEDENAVMISKELAELNGLSVGDKLLLHMSEFKASMVGVNPEETRMEVEIVGLFHATTKSSATLSNWSMDNSLYTTMNVVRYVRPDTPDEGYEKIHFYVDDPAELDRIVEQVKALPDIDPTDFIVQCDSSNVDSVMKPLMNMNRLVSVLIVLVLFVGAVILYLILSGRIKERVHESGILLSLGFSKKNIICQYLTEILVIAVLAFSLSIFTSGAVANTIGNQLQDYTMDNISAGTSVDASAENGSGTPGANVDGATIVGSGDFAPEFEGQGSLTKIEVTIQPLVILILYGAGIVIICFSVVIAAMPVLRMKPREILAQMS